MALIPSPQIDFTGASTANQKMQFPAKHQLLKISVFIEKEVEALPLGEIVDWAFPLDIHITGPLF